MSRALPEENAQVMFHLLIEPNCPEPDLVRGLDKCAWLGSRFSSLFLFFCCDS